MVRMRNVGSADQIVRLILGAALIAGDLLLRVDPWDGVGIAMVAVGAVLVATGLFRVCPAYCLVGLNTARKS